jgi:hypothetical protein
MTRGNWSVTFHWINALTEHGNRVAGIACAPELFRRAVARRWMSSIGANIAPTIGVSFSNRILFYRRI